MLNVSDKASQELRTFLASDKGQGSHLVIYFQGMG